MNGKSRVLNRCLILIAGLFISEAYAATMEITAKFSPDVNNPANDTFINTTKQSGYCVLYPAQCKGTFSISAGGIKATLASSGFTANSEPRKGMYFKFPGSWRDVTVRNTEDNTSYTVHFRVSAFSAVYRTRNSWTLKDHDKAWGDNFVYAAKPCTYSGVGSYSDKSYRWMWKYPASDEPCFKTAKIDLAGEPYVIDNVSLGYELKTPTPLEMNSGTYVGVLQLTTGPGGDIDFGDNFQASDSELLLNFTLSVNHELKVTPGSGATAVTLYPCYYGTECTKESAESNWERWMVTSIPPQKMTGISQFDISSSGSFTVYMACASGPALSADSCPMVSTKSKTVVPVKALLTLPANIGDKTGQRVVDKTLYTEKDSSRNRFTTLSFGTDKPGQVVFVIDKKDIAEMLKSRPDSWSGLVTLMFDPNLY